MCFTISGLAVLVCVARAAWSGAALGHSGGTLCPRGEPWCICVLSPGVPGGFAHQVCAVPRAVQQLSHQAVLHLQHSHHPAVCLGVKPLCHFPDVVCSFQWQLLGEFTGTVGSEYSITF